MIAGAPPVDWLPRLHRESVRDDHPEFSLLYHASLRPAAPPEYVVPGMVGLTFRLQRRPHDDRLVFATLIDLAAAVRLGERLGLEPARGIAFVDSHERVHVHLQLENVPEEVEEEHSRFVDAVWLSLTNPFAEPLVRAGEFGLVETVGHDFWERLVDATQAPEPPDACPHVRTRLLREDEPPHAPDEKVSLLRCLDCGRHLLMDSWRSRDGEGGAPRVHRELRAIPDEEAEERLRRPGRR